MREDEFRQQLRAALGEVPALNPPSLGRPSAHPRTYMGLMAIVAGALAIVLVIVLIGTRVMLRPRGNIQPRPAASPVATPPAADSFPCMLPVATSVQLGDQIINGVGFINVPTGDFRVDPSASVSGLPYSGGGPGYYSAALNRWLPATSREVSPDGTRYAHVTQSGASSQLHVVDVPTRADRILWTYAAAIGVEAWDESGILVAADLTGGRVQIWRIDPATGSASRRPASEGIPSLPPFWAIPAGSGPFSPIGTDGNGRIVIVFGSRDPGAKFKVVIVNVPEHNETTIYSGVAGEAKDFFPETALFDAHGIWMSNFDAKRVWLWTASSGLKGYVLSGLPTVPASIRNNVSFYVKGPCVPGTFNGVSA